MPGSGGCALIQLVCIINDLHRLGGHHKVSAGIDQKVFVKSCMGSHLTDIALFSNHLYGHMWPTVPRSH
jgi:hypothetical protein